VQIFIQSAWHAGQWTTYEENAASKTIRQRIGRRIMRKACFIGLSLLGFNQVDGATKAGSGKFARYFVGVKEMILYIKSTSHIIARRYWSGCSR
jgi:hypothetical protein